MPDQPIEFRDPPKSRHPGSESPWGPVAAQLRANPGKWALLRTDVTSTTAANIRRGVLAPFRPPESFEAVARTQPGYAAQRADIYARYIGENGEHR